MVPALASPYQNVSDYKISCYHMPLILVDILIFNSYTLFTCFFHIVALCGICPNPHKSIELQFSKNYLTTKDPSSVRIQKIQKIQKIYSPDPDSGSGIPDI